MPHDINGKELRVGSTVMVPCNVKAIHQTEEYCNVELETNLGMFPSGNRSAITLNSQQTVLKD
jgi:hypothetical protein